MSSRNLYLCAREESEEVTRVRWCGEIVEIDGGRGQMRLRGRTNIEGNGFPLPKKKKEMDEHQVIPSASSNMRKRGRFSS